MLSYRHAFHAGNHADVLKHCVLVALMRYLQGKDKPYWVIDTHAGAGDYRLDTGYAAQNAEWETGIQQLWAANNLPEPLADYVQLVRQSNPDGKLRRYPGSPRIASQLLRSQDRLKLFEMHPTDAVQLTKAFKGLGRQVKVSHEEGLGGLKASLPPPTRRALVLIDPSYEDKRDYAQVVQALKDSLSRFATGVYALWYPLLDSLDSRKLPDRLHAIRGDWLDVQLRVKSPSATGMFGSGMFILNPPWTLRATLEQCMPTLTQLLRQDETANFKITEHQAQT